jgi:hypothetical protein
MSHHVSNVSSALGILLFTHCHDDVEHNMLSVWSQLLLSQKHNHYTQTAGGGYSYGSFGSGSSSSRDGALGRTACTSVVRELAAPPSSWQYDDFFVSVLPPRVRALKPPAKARLPVAVQVRHHFLWCLLMSCIVSYNFSGNALVLLTCMYCLPSSTKLFRAMQ